MVTEVIIKGETWTIEIELYRLINKITGKIRILKTDEEKDHFRSVVHGY
jgi:hypothetical protein